MASDKDKDHRGSTATHASASSRSQHEQASKKEPEPKEPERHPAQPAPATPGVAQHDQQPQPDDPNAPPPPKPVAKEEAASLFHAGHKLRKKGDPPEKWFAMVRIANQPCLVTPLDDETEKAALDADLVLAD